MSHARVRIRRRRRALRQAIYDCEQCFCLKRVPNGKAEPLRCPKHGWRFLRLPLKRTPITPIDWENAIIRHPGESREDFIARCKVARANRAAAQGKV